MVVNIRTDFHTVKCLARFVENSPFCPQPPHAFFKNIKFITQSKYFWERGRNKIKTQKNNLKIDYSQINLRLPFITVTLASIVQVEARVEQVWVIILSVASFRLKMSLGNRDTSYPQAYTCTWYQSLTTFQQIPK